MKKLDKNSLDLVKENIKKLKEIFPDIFTEDKIDFEKLRENLGEFIEESDERYQFTWFGKKNANKIALTPTNATLRPDKNSSKNWDSTKNLYIEGDNLEVLKVIQKAYYKKIKMIYIDPPYNTGKDFIYRDNYQDNLKNYLSMTKQTDKDGNPLTTNSEKSGRKHSNWLNMMYPRLKLARNLLKDDGVIFISIDDNEVHNLRKICDEIFGEENFIAGISHKNRDGVSNDKIISENHNYILFYVKNYEQIHNKRELFGIKRTEEDFKNYTKQDEKGFYTLNPVTGPGGARKGNPYYEVLGVKNYWRYSKDTMNKLIKEGRIIKVNNNLYQKTYKNDLIGKKKGATTWWDKVGTTSQGTKVIKEIFDNKILFDFSKPVSLLKHIMNFIDYSSNDIILDFFSGSATTAHAVMELNAEDGGNRQFIMVQLPEPTNPKSEANRAGYKTISEIGKERIRRAGEKIKADYKDKEWIDKVDIGFKVFKLDSTNIKEWDLNPNNLKESLLDYGEFIKEDRSQEDLLYEILLKYGIDLTTPIEEREVNGKKIYIVGFGSLIIYFNEINIEVAKEIINLVEKHNIDFSVLILKDDSFATSKDKVNIIEFFKQYNLFDKIVTL